MQADVAKLSPTDTPKYLSTDFDEKINALKRETNYLLGKAQRFVPKQKTSTTTAAPKVTTSSETKSDDGTSSTTASTEGRNTASTVDSECTPIFLETRPEL